MHSKLSEVFRSHPVHLYEDHFDFESVREVPDSYVWPPVIDYPSEDHYNKEAVPIIDLMDPDAVKQIGMACETWGVFQVTNHGIPMRLLEDVESEVRRLFFLPAHQKLKAARSPDAVSGYGRARISSFFPKLMWSEGFTIVGPPVEHARRLWPQHYQKFCDVMEEYKKEMKKLASKIMWSMLSSLGIAKDDLEWASSKGETEGGCAALQLNSYPPCPDPKRAMGLAAHSDSTLLTVLYQNSTTGLQVMRAGIGWVTVAPTSGALVINIGDLLHILSNGRYPSVLHRAVVNRTHHRLSVAYLFGPPTNIQISPLTQLIDSKNPPLYCSKTWSEYLGLKATHFNKALSSIRLIHQPALLLVSS